jgi:hypothetical protein
MQLRGTAIEASADGDVTQRLAADETASSVGRP